MSDYEKAVELLTEAGFVKIGIGHYVNIRPESVDKIQLLVNSFTIQTNRPLSDLHTLLNLITAEKVEKAVRDNLLGWLNENAVILKRDVDTLVGDILADIKEDA